VDIQRRKDELRRLILSRRERTTPQERTERAAAIVRTLTGLPELAAARSVLAYASVRSEVPTAELLRWILESGKSLAVPAVTGEGSMIAARAGSLGHLAPGFRGIPEPPLEPAGPVDVAVVPGVAFDLACARLGHGGGFFDAFLAAVPATTKIGVCFDFQVVDELPAEPHDVRMDLVVTESRVLRR